MRRGADAKSQQRRPAAQPPSTMTYDPGSGTTETQISPERAALARGRPRITANNGLVLVLLRPKN